MFAYYETTNLLGPHFTEGHVSAAHYRDFLENLLLYSECASDNNRTNLGYNMVCVHIPAVFTYYFNKNYQEYQ